MIYSVSSTPPYVTVLMSCYNAAQWLDQAIQSVLNQTYADFEFIIVNDGSEDDTLAVIRKYSELDERVIIIDKPNTGLADSLNTGISRSRGKWIARLDADDVAAPTRLDRQVQYVAKNPGTIFLGTGMYEVDENGTNLKVHKYPAKHKNLVRHLSRAQKFPPHASAFYRTDIVRKIGGYRTRIRRAQDRDLWLRLADHGDLGCLKEPLTYIRNHDNRVSFEESGKRQKTDSRVAMTGYWLRKMGAADPVDAGDDVFEEFRGWVVTGIASTLEVHDVKKKWKLHLRKRRLREAFLLIICEPLSMIRSLKFRFYGEGISLRLPITYRRQFSSLKLSNGLLYKHEQMLFAQESIVLWSPFT